MARGVTLTQMIADLRAEVGHSTSSAAGKDVEASLKRKLVRTQIMLYDDYDWPFLREKWAIGTAGKLSAGQRYYDFPTEAGFPGNVINLERLEHVTINYSGKPVPLDRGISWEQYAQYNSDNNEGASPVRRWDVKRTTDDKEQIEVWPIPVDDTQILEITGIKSLRPLISNSDVCDLDDVAIVLTAAAEILARAKSADTNDVKAAAAARIKQMKGRVKAKSRMINLAGSPDSWRTNRGKTIIRIGSQSN